MTLQVLHAIYRTASTAANLKDFSAGILRILSNAYAAEEIKLIVSNPRINLFLTSTYRCGSENSQRKIVMTKGSRASLCAVDRECFDACDTRSDDSFMRHSIVFINVLGFIEIKRGRDAEPFDDQDARNFHAITEQIAICVKNFNLFEENQRLICHSVNTFKECLGMHTPTSDIEMTFFKKIIQAIAKKIDLSQQQLRALEFAAILHDAGKFQIPQELLEKQQPLTDEEKDLIRRHPVCGAELFKDFDALKPVVPIILHHHEKFDGTGYPKGLKGERIPVEARVMAILDSFDAMYFGRSYRKGLSFEDTCAELRKNGGTQFDPSIVNIFLSIVERKSFRNILNKLTKKV